MFLIPFILCLTAGIGIKSFTESHILNSPDIIEENLTSVINYEMRLITDRDESQYAQLMTKVAKSIDDQEGVAASLFKKHIDHYDTIYNYRLNPDSDISGIKILDDYFHPDKIKFNENTFLTGKYQIIIKYDDKRLTYTFHYVTFQDFVIIWCVRPDIVQSYFVDTEKMFLIITFILFINAIASFGSLVAYYSLENRINHTIRKRN